MTDQLYAVKKVRLHLPLSEDLRSEIKNHKVYREVMALASL
jgi:hypothetical protein